MRCHIREVKQLKEAAEQDDIFGELARVRLECYQRAVITDDEDILMDLNHNIVDASGVNYNIKKKGSKKFLVEHLDVNKRSIKIDG